MQRVIPDIEISFQVVKDALHYISLPDLFQVATAQIPLRAITDLLAKQAGIAIPDPTQTTRANWTASCVITGHLVAAIYETDEFWLDNNALLMGEEREEIRQRHAEEVDTALGEARAIASNTDDRRLRWIQRKGVWLSVLPSTINGKELGAQ